MHYYKCEFIAISDQTWGGWIVQSIMFFGGVVKVKKRRFCLFPPEFFELEKMKMKHESDIPHRVAG